MTLFWFISVVASLAFGSLPPASTELSHCVGTSLALLLVWCLLVQMPTFLTKLAADQGLDPLQAARMLERQLDILRWMGLIVAAVCLVGFGLAPAVQTWPIFASSMTLQAFVLLFPAITLTSSVWWSEHRYGVAMGYTECRGRDAIHQWLRAMLSSGGWIVGPVLLILGATDLMRWTSWTDNASSAAFMGIVGVISVPFLVPLFVRVLWKTKEINSIEFGWVCDILRTAGIRRMPVRVWHTEMKSCNAVVAGFIPRLRSLLVTDRLLRDLSKNEIAMVLLHEIAHVRRGHVWLRVVSMGPAWVLASTIASFMPDSAAAAIGTNLLGIAFTLLTLRLVAHATEYDADRVACELSMQLPVELDPPLTKSMAADRYGQTLRRVTLAESRSDRSTWLHPSVHDRCERLQNWANVSVHPASSPLSA